MHLGRLTPFRGQYCFGSLPSWQPEWFIRHHLPDGSALATHKDLPVAVVNDDNGYLAVIGYCFDHRRPADALADIAKRLSAFPIRDLFGETSSLVGRWVVLRSAGAEKVAFSDAGGTMPLIYKMGGGSHVCASSSRLIAALDQNVAPNPAITDEFRALQSKVGRHAGQSFPLIHTDYADVLALLPNHYLDLASGKTARYYFGPSAHGKYRAREMAPLIGDIFVNIVRAASHRHKLSYAATGGFDSRIIAGAIGNVPGLAGETDFFTFRYPNDEQGVHDDIVIARQVAHRIGAHHRIIEAESDHPAPAVSQVCRRSEEFLATGFEGWAEKSSSEVEAGRLILMGWASEITRRFFRWPGSDRVTPAQLAACGGVHGVPPLSAAFADWLPDAQRAQEQTGLPILDLLYWENRVGRWCGGGLNILNTGANWMTLYSCRDLLNLMLSVREPERGGSRERLHRDIIAYLKPELAQIPINPTPLRTRAKSAASWLARSLAVKARRAVGR